MSEIEGLGNGMETGQYVGTGEALTVNLPFVPRRVEVTDWTEDGDVVVVKTDQMEGGSASMTKTVGSAVKRAKILTEAVTIAGAGFTVGTSAYVNTEGHAYLWEAS